MHVTVGLCTNEAGHCYSPEVMTFDYQDNQRTRVWRGWYGGGYADDVDELLGYVFNAMPQGSLKHILARIYITLEYLGMGNRTSNLGGMEEGRKSCVERGK